MAIVIDGTAAINDQRAIRRYCHHLLTELAGIESGLDLVALYLGCRRDQATPTRGRSRIREIRSAIPGRLLTFAWNILARPDISFWTGVTPALVHFTGGSTYIPVRNCAVLTTMHGFLVRQMPNFFPVRQYDQVLRQLDQTIARSDHFITVSETNRQELMALWNVPEDRITAIPLGVSPEFRQLEITAEHRAKLLRRFGIPDQPYLLYVGALEPHKNIGGIIDAFARLEPARRCALSLVLVGAETPYCQSFREQARESGILDHLRFVSYLPPGSTDLACLYNLAELLIFPTFYEGWASPPLEAMSCGTPAVVADIPALRESTGGAAMLCNPDDPADIATKIATLLDDPSARLSCRRLGLAFAAQFTWRKCAERTLELYRHLV